MPIKKSDLYSSIWASCDALRGGMDASQYKDYVLFMLFIKYISDKYADSKDFSPDVTVPKGSSFKDMVALKGKPDIGDKINTKIIQPLIDANERQLSRNDFPNFNDPTKLGDGKEMVDRLTNLIAIFEKPELDFSSNRAEHDDILGDAYEYLMRHFATESGKSKGQFYTPAEVSRVIAKVLGITPKNTRANTTAYDPTCGSGSLLLKVAAEAGKRITLEGQEKDVTTAGLARMNTILHSFPTATIVSGNTLAAPKFLNGSALRTYDYVVANPPFSDKNWTTGLNPEADLYQRFEWGVPPAKQGDYAYLLHIIRSMKSDGKAACILPHGVLFRGNAEAVIRKNLVESGYLKGIIGLPANLFYGTSIPACIVVLDKENASARKGVFMIDASKGFIKDGNKNRLRERDIHKIVDTFAKQADIPGYARMVPLDEIASTKNEYNLNLPRYIDTTDPEDIQDIDGHLRGGIPDRDIDALSAYWEVLPSVRPALFKKADRKGYSNLKVPVADIKSTIFGHPEFTAFNQSVTRLLNKWKKTVEPQLREFAKNGHPKALIAAIAEELLGTFKSAPLLDPYAVYQHLMDYWAETMQDDCYIVSADGWKATPARIIETDKKGKSKDKGWACDLLPKPFVIARYFTKEQAALDAKQTELETITAKIAELEEEHGGEEGALGALNKIAKGEVSAQLKEVKNNPDDKDEVAILKEWLDLNAQESDLKRAVKEADESLDKLAHDKYGALKSDDVRALLVETKWLAAIEKAIQGELDRVSQSLTTRVRTLADRYATPLPKIEKEVAALSAKVEAHLKKMGATRLPGFHGKWEVKRLGDVATVSKGTQLHRSETDEGGTFAHLNGGTAPSSYTNKFNTDGNTIAISEGGNSCGYVQVMTHPYWCGGHCYSVIPNGVDNQLLYYALKGQEAAIMGLRVGSGLPNVQKSSLLEFKILLPATYPEQTAIAEVLSDMDAELAALEARRDKTRALKQAMMQELLTGRTRLL